MAPSSSNFLPPPISAQPNHALLGITKEQDKMVASIIETLIKNYSPCTAQPPDASDKHFNFVLRTKYSAMKVRFQADNIIAANQSTLGKIHIESIQADAEAAAVRTAATTAARTAMMRSATVFALPFLATGLAA